MLKIPLRNFNNNKISDYSFINCLNNMDILGK